MSDKSIELIFRACRAAKQKEDNMIIIATQDTVDYEKLIQTMGGEVVKTGNVPAKEPKPPKFSIGDHLETIEAYEAPGCPYECGTVTDISEARGTILYEIDYEILIYEKWLRVVVNDNHEEN